jgi:hypothetical protein
MHELYELHELHELYELHELPELHELDEMGELYELLHMLRFLFAMKNWRGAPEACVLHMLNVFGVKSLVYTMHTV